MYFKYGKIHDTTPQISEVLREAIRVSGTKFPFPLRDLCGRCLRSLHFFSRCLPCSAEKRPPFDTPRQKSTSIFVRRSYSQLRTDLLHLLDRFVWHLIDTCQFGDHMFGSPAEYSPDPPNTPKDRKKIRCFF